MEGEALLFHLPRIVPVLSRSRNVSSLADNGGGALWARRG